MTEPKLHFISLVDQHALQYLKDKKPLQSFSHYDIWLQEHQYAITVAKMMNDDLLADTQKALTTAIESGTSFYNFQKQLKPYLMSKGWWGVQSMLDPATGKEKQVQLGSTRRLKTIYHTNLATAYAAGQWARIQEVKDAFPYLKYLPSVSDNKRDAHKAYYNKIYKVDDPIWQHIFPPNGYGCKCQVRQLTRKQALKERKEDIANNPNAFTDEQKQNAQNGILNDDNTIKWVDAINPRTGEVVRVPDNITPSFAHNHGDRLGGLLNVYAQKHGIERVKEVMQQTQAYIVEKTGLNYIDLSHTLPEKAEIERLTLDTLDEKPKPAEAIIAAKWQQYYGVQLVRVPKQKVVKGEKTKPSPDFLIVDNTKPREEWKSLDFMFALEKDANVEAFLRELTKSPKKWADNMGNIERHAKKADIVPVCIKHFDNNTLIKILGFVLSLPKEQQEKIIFIKE